MDSHDPNVSPKEVQSAANDLARRLARYRQRVEAENRPRSVKAIDRAIEDAHNRKAAQK